MYNLEHEKEAYLKSVFTFWKTPYLPSYLQNLHLQIINHKGRICMSANKRTIMLNTKIHLGFGFPCEPGTSRFQRLNDVSNNEKKTQKMMKPVLKSIKPNNIHAHVKSVLINI